LEKKTFLQECYYEQKKYLGVCLYLAPVRNNGPLKKWQNQTAKLASELTSYFEDWSMVELSVGLIRDNLVWSPKDLFNIKGCTCNDKRWPFTSVKSICYRVNKVDVLTKMCERTENLIYCIAVDLYYVQDTYVVDWLMELIIIK